MFSSITSFLFGSNQSATTNREVNQNPTRQPSIDDDSLRIDAEHTIEVTSLTPSVAGTTLTASGALRQGKRCKLSKNRRNRSNKNKKPTPIPTITKLLTPSESFDQEIDEDDWFIVEKEAEEVSLPRTDSEEESSLVEVKPRAAAAAAPPNANQAAQLPPTQQRRRPHINSHSLYSGPRPQQQRNYLQRARNGGERGAHFSVSTLSPPRSIASAGAGSVASVGAAAAIADGGVTQSLYVVSSNREAHNNSGGSNAIGANVSMEESWFVTPPPCFTSIGPINMETSPFENLLIEHPSMSVYYSIRTAQEAADPECFVNLNLGLEDSQQGRVVASQAASAESGRIAQAEQPRAPGPRIDHYTAAQLKQEARASQRVCKTLGVKGSQQGRVVASQAASAQSGRIAQIAQPRAPGPRIDPYVAAQLKQELLGRASQRSHDKKQHQSLCRGAMKRANQVRDFQSKGQRQRRADMQHCKVASGANNNRKCNF